MKKLLTGIAVFMMVAAVATAAPIKLKLSEVHADGYPTTMADKQFAKLVNEKTSGRVEIEVYFGGTLYGSEPESIEAMIMGELGFARVSASPVSQFVPEVDAIQLPYLYKSGEHMWAVLNGEVGQSILANIQKSGSGLIGLCYYDAGSRNFYLTKKITTPAGLKGLKIRMQDNKMMCRMTELLGGTPVTGIGSNEIYSSITSGVIDGAENNWPTYHTKGDYKAAKFFILDGHTRVPEILLASESSLKKAKVTDKDIAIIKACAKETQEYEIAQWAAMEKKSQAAVLADGATAVTLTPVELKQFQDAMAPLYKEYGSKYTTIINKISEVGKKF